jgi:hypothetical protein
MTNHGDGNRHAGEIIPTSTGACSRRSPALVLPLDFFAPQYLPARRLASSSFQPPLALEHAMQFLLLVYTDDTLLEALPAGDYDRLMKGCFVHADELRAQGKLLQSQQLEAPATAKAVRIRKGQSSVLDGPFAETKEVLAGFNLIEADSLEEAVRIAHEFPWAATGCIEVRPVRDMDAVRQRVGAPLPA